MTPEEIRQRLDSVDRSKLTGQTPARFREVFRQVGLFWTAVLDYFATEGYCWGDAANFYGVKEDALRAVVRNRGQKFPWQGARSERWRERRCELYANRGAFYHPPRKQYTAFGTTADLDTLIDRFSPEGMTYPTAHSRIRRGWPIEDALTIPAGQKPGGQPAWQEKEAA